MNSKLIISTVILFSSIGIAPEAIAGSKDGALEPTTRAEETYQEATSPTKYFKCFNDYTPILNTKERVLAWLFVTR